MHKCTSKREWLISERYACVVTLSTEVEKVMRAAKNRELEHSSRRSELRSRWGHNKHLRVRARAGQIGDCFISRSVVAGSLS